MRLHQLLASIFIAVLLAGCGQTETESHGHAHEEATSLVYTDYTEHTELFVEFPALQQGESSRFLAHLTNLSDFSPVTEGAVYVELRQNGQLKAGFRVKQPTRDGLFTPVVTPRDAGRYQLSIRLENDQFSSTHELGEVRVFAAHEHAQVSQPEVAGDITYLKEQQWQQPFATTKAQQLSLSESVPAFATVKAPANKQATIRAPQAGYFFPDASVTAGHSVERGDTLGLLVPRAQSSQDIISLQLELAEYQSELTLAEQEVQRLQQLVDNGAIPETRLQTTKAKQQQLTSRVNATQARIQQGQLGETEGGIAIKSPISGKILSSPLASGMYVDEQQVLTELAANEQRWLELSIPERFGQHVQAISGAWLDTDEQIVRLDEKNSIVAARSLMVQPVSRTYSVTLGFAADTWQPMIGQTFAAKAITSANKAAIAIPVSAVIRQEGKDVVFVHTGGETFERREITLGIQDGENIEVTRGLQAGERVVSTGAYDVRLAALGGEEIGHGHAH